MGQYEYDMLTKLVESGKIRSRGRFFREMIRRHGKAILEGREPPI